MRAPRPRSPRTPRAADGLTALLAVVVHLGVLGLGFVVSKERPLVARSSRGGDDPTWLDLDEAPVRGAGEDPPPSGALAANAGPAAALRSRAAEVPRAANPGSGVGAAPRQAPPVEPPVAPPDRPATPGRAEEADAPAKTGTEGGEAPATAGAATADDYGGPPGPAPGDARGIAPGLGGTPTWSLPGIGIQPGAPAAPTAAPAARPVDPTIAGKVLASTLLTRDKELGLQMPAAGVVATALSDTVRGSDAPGDARATFEVKLGGDGAVLGVRVVSASAGKADAWDRVANKAAAALAARSLALGEAGKDGVTVKVTVTSKVVYPTHTTERGEVAPVCAEDMLLQMADSMGQLAGDGKLPNLIELKDGRFCIPIGVRLTGDLSNLGAHRQRVVSATYDVVLPDALKLQSGEVLPIDTRAPWLRNLPSRGPRLPIPDKWKKKKNKKKPVR